MGGVVWRVSKVLYNVFFKGSKFREVRWYSQVHYSFGVREFICYSQVCLRYL